MANAPFCAAIADAWRSDFEGLRNRATDKNEQDKNAGVMRGSLQRHMGLSLNAKKEDGFSRLEKCRYALRVLDGNGWKRSFHQREVKLMPPFILALDNVCTAGLGYANNTQGMVFYSNIQL